MNTKVEAVFLFSPKKLLKEPGGDVYYIAYSYKYQKKFNFSYLIAHPCVNSGKLEAKFATNTEEVNNLTDLYSKYYSFVENFAPHQKETDLQYILAENPTLESLHSRFVDYAAEVAAKFTKEYLEEHGKELILVAPPKVKLLKNKVLPKIPRVKKVSKTG